MEGKNDRNANPMRSLDSFSIQISLSEAELAANLYKALMAFLLSCETLEDGIASQCKTAIFLRVSAAGIPCDLIIMSKTN